MKYIPLSFVILFCFVLGGLMFKSMTPPRCESLLQNDNIFVLTGDTRRIPYAVKTSASDMRSRLREYIRQVKAEDKNNDGQ